MVEFELTGCLILPHTWHNMIISHEKKFIFFACGKTGTTSIEKMLDRYHDEHEIIRNIDKELNRLRKKESKPYALKHVRPGFAKKFIPPGLWDNYFKFVFVRNPWDWVIAQFCYNHNDDVLSTLFKFEKVHFDAIWHILKIHNQSPRTDSYRQFDFAFSEDGRNLVDFIGRFETIQTDYNMICERIGIKAEKLPHENKGNHLDYRMLYTEETRELVGKLYQKDIEFLNYEF